MADRTNWRDPANEARLQEFIARKREDEERKREDEEVRRAGVGKLMAIMRTAEAEVQLRGVRKAVTATVSAYVPVKGGIVPFGAILTKARDKITLDWIGLFHGLMGRDADVLTVVIDEITQDDPKRQEEMFAALDQVPRLPRKEYQRLWDHVD